MKTKKATALIIDLRENGGGALTEAVELSGLFISDGPIVQVRDAYNRIRVHEDPDSTQVYTGPLLVMIDRFSAKWGLQTDVHSPLADSALCIQPAPHPSPAWKP